MFEVIYPVQTVSNTISDKSDQTYQDEAQTKLSLNRITCMIEDRDSQKFWYTSWRQFTI